MWLIVLRKQKIITSPPGELFSYLIQATGNRLLCHFQSGLGALQGRFTFTVKAPI